MKPHWSLLNLDIAGFASVLETPTLPRVLAPVFRDRNQQHVLLLPPFTLVGDEVFNATCCSVAEFEAMSVQGKLTRLEKPIPGKMNHDLWLNPEGIVAYDSKSAVKRAFADIFTKHLALAEEKLGTQDYDAACQHAAIARAVKPSHLDPLVIRAAAERMSGQTSRFAFTCHIATDYVSAAEFDQLVDARTGEESAADTRGSAVMMKVALRKSRFATA